MDETPDLKASAPPWDYNPSAWSQRIPISILAMAGFLISAYMALFQWDLIDSAWDPFFGDQTEKVLKSDVSHRMWAWFGIPDAALGAIAYLGDAIYGLAGSTRRWQYRPWMTLLFGLDVIPLGGVSAILVFMQATVVGSWCFLCLVTAVISLILVYMAYDEVWSCILYLRRVWKHTHDWGLMWSVLWGDKSDRANEVALTEASHVAARS